MNPPGQQTAPHYVKVACEHCTGGIEFDCNQLARDETRPVECPHCHLDTMIFVPQEHELQPVIDQVHPFVPTARPDYATVACEHCDCGIEFDANQLAGDETRVVQCPHCHMETTLFVVERDESTPFIPENKAAPCPDRVQSAPDDESPPRPPPVPASAPVVAISTPSLAPTQAASDSCRAAATGSGKPIAAPTAHDAEWVPPGVEASVEGFRIPGGMIYLGKRLACVYGGGVEPSLINPTKPIQRSGADCHVSFMGYWPSYETISPESRASYLQWLSTGKCDPEADVGYVFLYFYGLERRALWDARRDSQAKEEIPLISREILRLMEIYGHSGSFRGYASSLVQYLAAARCESPVLDAGVPPEGTGNRGVSFELRLGLGLLAKSGRPLPADWALAWLQSDPTVRLRTAASRCAEIFAQLFKAEYAKAFVEGMRLPESKIRLKITHRPASASFSFQTSDVNLDIPDVSVMSGPVNELRDLAEACTERLDAYSRFVARNPDQAQSFDALLLLSPDLWPDPVQDSLKALRSEAIEGRSVFSLLDILRAFSEGSVPTKSKYTALSRALGSLGLGVEPDPRSGGQPPGMGDPIVLFPCERLAEDRPFSADFASGALLLHLASAVAGCEGDVGEAEEALLLQHIEKGLNVTPCERQRLAARLQLYRVQPPSLTGLKKRIEELDRVARESLGDFLVLVVQADGVVKPEEVRVLEKLWKLLALEQASLYTRLHGLLTSEAVTVGKADAAPSSSSIPTPSVSAFGPLGLDPKKLAALVAETARSSARLGAFFAESEAPEVEEPAQTQAPEDTPALLLGLDKDHHDLLQMLLQRPQWSRAELEELCADRGLMVDGAIECINEASFDELTPALIEQNDQVIYINRELIQEGIA
jgi:uncharacterized tellurite resistance protein B-like protein